MPSRPHGKPKIVGDYHTHTSFSHGRGSVEDNVEAAAARDLREIAITDHGPAALGYGVTGTGVFRAIRREVERCDRSYREVKVLMGVEANVVSLKGDLDVPPSMLPDFDIVLVGLHDRIIPQTMEVGWHLWVGNRSTRRAEVRRVNTDMLTKAVERWEVDIVTHPGLKMDIDTARLAEVCAGRGTALEINAAHGYLSRDYLRVAAKSEVNFFLSSDAHRPERVGDIAAALSLVKEVNLDWKRIINLRSSWLEEKLQG